MGENMKDKKTIAISLPCWNEEANIENMVNAIEKIFNEKLSEYNYIIQFIDNCSTDNTRNILRQISSSDKHVRAIFNVSNVSGSAIHGILQTNGDCCIHMASDFQDPPELIVDLVKKWEEGAKVVCAIKTSSEEKKSMWMVRSLYYKIMSSFSTIPQIKHFTGFGLYDKEFLTILRQLGDPTPTLRGIVAEYGYNVEKVYYKQPIRKHGKSSMNFMRNYDYAMKSFTTYSKSLFHIVTLLGIGIAGISFLVTIIGVLLILFAGLNVSLFNCIVLGVIIFVGAGQFALIGLLGEYVINILVRTIRRPLAIEAERVGFEDDVLPNPESTSPYSAYPPFSNR